MKFDDDIPILTQVLRTRTGRMHAPDPRLLPPVDRTPPTTELLPEHLIIIGHDARAEIEPYTASEFDAATAPVDVEAAPALIEPLAADGAVVPIEAEYGEQHVEPHVEPRVADPTEREAERDALLSSEGAEGIVERPAAARANASVAVEAAGSIDAPESLEGESELVDASLTEEPVLDTDALATRVHDAVLQDLATRIDTELDARIAHALRFEVETALASLQGGLREQLATSLRDVVHRAVQDEIGRLKSDDAR